MSEPLVEMVRTDLAGLAGWGPSEVAATLQRRGLVVSDRMVLDIVAQLRRTSVGAGPLDPLLQLPGVTDVLVNGPDQVFIDRGSGLEPADVRFSSGVEVRQLATRLAALAGRRLDDASPWVDARLPDGTRLHAVLSVLASPGTCISLRVPARDSFTLDDLQTAGSVNAETAALLATLIERKVAFLISGGTGSGKTTLLACLLGLVPGRERLVIVEDSRELAPRHPHCIRLECRHRNAEGAGEVTMTDLVRQALRMRPDRLILGEARGAELCDLLTALNTGHEGGCGTLHANSAADVPARLEALAALGGMQPEALHAQAAAALQVVIHVRRWPDGRRGVAEVGLVHRSADRRIDVLPALVADEPGISRHDVGWEALNKLVHQR